eukprot:13057-Karenia_brevis.AAC.1
MEESEHVMPFVEGDSVEAHSLLGAANLNGKHGKVIGFQNSGSESRLKVEFQQFSETKALLVRNVKHLEAVDQSCHACKEIAFQASLDSTKLRIQVGTRQQLKQIKRPRHENLRVGMKFMLGDGTQTECAIEAGDKPCRAALNLRMSQLRAQCRAEGLTKEELRAKTDALREDLGGRKRKAAMDREVSSPTAPLPVRRLEWPQPQYVRPSHESFSITIRIEEALRTIVNESATQPS